ncbi:hypothetical protein [Rufibacter roseus]|uniref:Lipoprotein n=1 Tax=Rufibacter roseus TaxID=1567108 RepID=A0ABW2DP16_9BACT|nr:hypothetical protein [Rufibacter roseus]
MKRLLPYLCVLLLSCSGNASEERITELASNGVKVENERVVAWFPEDSLSETRMKEITDTLQLVVSASENFLGKHDWQEFNGEQINYYFNEGNFVASASPKGDVFIPLWRIQSGKAPLFHETMHVLLRSKKGNWSSESKVNSFFNIPIWFTEGMAEYMALKTAHETKLPNFDLQKGGGYLKVDSTCQAALQTEEGKYVLDYIGEEGAMLKLFTSDRKTYAPPFYNCSCSFTKYLAETYGKEKLLQSYSNFKDEIETIEKLTGKSMATLKAEWLKSIDKESVSNQKVANL